MEKEAQEQEVKDKEKAKSLGTEYSSTATQEQSECAGLMFWCLSSVWCVRESELMTGLGCVRDYLIVMMIIVIMGDALLNSERERVKKKTHFRGFGINGTICWNVL